jgi:hypothetical protein
MAKTISPKGHKLAGYSYGVETRCECGWHSVTWYGQGARRNALGEWRQHQESVHRKAEAADRTVRVEYPPNWHNLTPRKGKTI